MSEEDNSVAWGRLSLVGRTKDDAPDGCERGPYESDNGDLVTCEEAQLLRIMSGIEEATRGGTSLLLTSGGPAGDCAMLDAPADGSHEAQLAEAIHHLWLGAMVAGQTVEGYQQAAEVFLRKLPADLREAIRLEVCRG